MENEHALKRFRIGDFAKHLGVTSDFLKHYENAGLLKVHHSESGYRYYTFDQSARIIEYMRLRNYGVAVKDMQQCLTDSPKAVIEELNKKTDELKRQIDRLSAIVAEHERLKNWFESHRARPLDWEVREVEPYCFLPHTDNQDFNRDDRIHELMEDWVTWLPVTKSAMKIEITPAGMPNINHWGFAVAESVLKHLGIADNDALERMHFGKAFVCHFCGLEGAFTMADIASGEHPAFKLLASLGFEPQGTALLINEMRLTDDTGASNTGLGRIIIPIVC